MKISNLHPNFLTFVSFTMLDGTQNGMINGLYSGVLCLEIKNPLSSDSKIEIVIPEQIGAD